MPKKLPELSIFFPFWNEEKNIGTVIKKAIPVAEKLADKWEIIMIDDGSLDNTLSLAQKLTEKNKNLKLISHFPNRGYGAALKEGFNKSKFKYIIFNDGDNQFDFSEADKFINLIRDADIVIGYRKKRNDVNLLKRLLLMNMLKAWDLILFHFYFRDIDCGFKMFTREGLDKIGPLRSEGAMITTEILAKAKKKKLKIKEIGVTHYPRINGAQSGANFPVVLRAVLESLQVWFDLHYGRA
jgi:glycosyltransferase involved in cell wall biosynthesis